MKLLITTIACVLAAATAAPQANKMSFWPEPRSGFGGRIINGEAATQGQAPFICSMRFIPGTTASHSCGASILNANWVVSAAHCITEVPNIGRLDLQCGVTHRANDVATQQVRDFDRVTNVRNHPGWVAGGGVGPDDITVINVPVPFTFNDFVQPIRQLGTGIIPTGTCRLFGWGSINNSNIFPNIPQALQTAEKDLLTMAQCREGLTNINPDFVEPLSDTNICSARGHISACGGDSGGPLVIYEGAEAIQVGVVSWGISPCGNLLNVPSVFARNSAYIEWMREQVAPATIQTSSD